MATKTTEIRIRWEPEDEPDLSYLEQWDTPEKYYGGEPTCPHGSPLKYASGHTWESDGCAACEYPDEGEGGIYRTEYDGSDSEMGGVCLDGDRRVPFDEYMQTYGDPAYHEVLCAIVESRCGECSKWESRDSLGNVDFLVSGWQVMGAFSEEEIPRMRDEYQRDTSRQMVAQVRKEISEEIAHGAPIADGAKRAAWVEWLSHLCVDKIRAAEHVQLGRLPFTLKLEVPAETIAGLLCSAFEGGSGYWIETADVTGYPFGLDARDFREGGRMQTGGGADYWERRQLVPLHEGGAVEVVVSEEEPIPGKGRKFKLDREAVARGLAAMQAKHPKHFADALADDGSADADTGDVFLQCCLFGEVIFG